MPTEFAPRKPRPRFALTLSGGGFRAALFHIGLLARLAELDLLRRVEVISTVSGGSILGAYYALELRALLEAKRDEDLTADDFVALVERLEVDFVRAVQTNVRMRVFSNARALARMGWKLSYSRTDRLGELYDRFFFGDRSAVAARLARKEAPPHSTMSDLIVRPRGGPASFRPREGNRGRTAKVPMLFLNCTTLNTGRHWVFTPEWMGESFHDTGREHTDKNALLNGLPYGDAPEQRHRTFHLGMAVAASSCVPALFPPLPIKDLFDKWLVQLVDGGVHDNQGLAVVEEYDCEAVLMSDASMQMLDVQYPDTFASNVYGRTNEVLMDRSRDRNAASIARRDADRPGAVVHLKHGLSREELSIPSRPPAHAPDVSDLNPRVQQLLARVRTDLDAFSDIESDALMAAGYSLASCALSADPRLIAFVRGADGRDARRGKWRFAWILPELRRAEPSPFVLRHLTAASSRFGRIWRIAPWTLGVTLGLAVLAAWALWRAIRETIDAPLFVWAPTTRALLFGALGGVGLVLLLRAWWIRMRVRKLASMIVALLVLWPITNVFLWLWNPLYAWVGRRRPPA